MEALPPPISVDRALTLCSPTFAIAQEFGPQVEQVLVNTTVEGVSHEDPPPPDLKDEPVKEVATRGSRPTTNW